MLQEANWLKSRAGKAIDGELAVVHISEWNTSQVFVNQMVDFIYALANGCRANLFIIAYDDNLVPHVDRHQRRNIRLAGFIDNNYVETIAFHVKVSCDITQRHNPDRYCCLTYRYQLSGLCYQAWCALACSLTHLSHKFPPALQCSSLLKGCAPDLLCPCSLLNQVCGNGE